MLGVTFLSSRLTVQNCNSIRQVSGIILMVCAKIASSRDPHLYPGGKSRAGAVDTATPNYTTAFILWPRNLFHRQCTLGVTSAAEPVGIVVFSAVMGMVWRVFCLFCLFVPRE